MFNKKGIRDSVFCGNGKSFEEFEKDRAIHCCDTSWHLEHFRECFTFDTDIAAASFHANLLVQIPNICEECEWVELGSIGKDPGRLWPRRKQFAIGVSLLEAIRAAPLLVIFGAAMAEFNVLHNTLTALAATLQQLVGATQNNLNPTVTQPIAAPIPILPTPPITSYTSSRSQALPPFSQGHPAPGGSLSASNYQPILGVAGLRIPMGGHTNNARTSTRGSQASTSQLTAPQISQANAGRQLAISTHFPATTSLVQRAKRRGNAVHPPALPRGPTPTLLETVSFIDSTTGARMIRIRFEVLPHASAATDLILCRRLRTSEVGFLTGHNLLHNFVLPENTSVVELLRLGARAMEDSPGRYQFGADNGARASRHLPHETLPLQLLSLINKGNPRTNGVSYLTSRHPVALNTTIGDFTTPVNRSKFGHPTLCVENTEDGDHLIVRAGIRRPGVRFTGFESDWPRTHTCLSTRHRHLIDEATEGDFDPEGDSTETVTSGGEPDSPSDDDEENFPDAVMSPPTPTPAPYSLPTRRALAVQPVVRVRSLQEFGIPPKLFTAPFIPLPGRFHAAFEARDPLNAVYELASGGRSVAVLEVEGTDIDTMVEVYAHHIGVAADSGDYTSILSPRRNFRKLRADGTVLSFGVGPEREVLYALFQRYARQSGKYFTPREQGMYAISTTISMAHRFLLSPVRIRELKILGVVLVLMLLHGMTPAPVSPALFQFAFHGCNLDALTPEFLGEWYPALRLVVTEWIAMGPTGDVTPFQAHFSTYHDLQVSSLQSRDGAQHDALGADMLYTALFGPQPASHPEPKALFSGMEMLCADSGFTMTELFRSFPGGTERLLSQKWASHIIDFTSIEPNLDISAPPAVEVARLMDGLPFIVDPTAILRAFMQRTGIPCPSRFAAARSTIHPLVPLSDIDSPAFRPRMLAWATTGSPDSELSKEIFVNFSPPGCTEYQTDTVRREANMANGTIAFRTCYRTARIPLSYLVGLHHASYPTLDAQGHPTEPLTLQDAIDDWLLIQITSSIGDLSML
ncbi:hypothetical protein B0H11DRAFT_2368605 [Mycena galericulata]|nr:hypothetical protein B0H11DRAFT_2368605 [Mycena galericulata]